MVDVRNSRLTSFITILQSIDRTSNLGECVGGGALKQSEGGISISQDIAGGSKRRVIFNIMFSKKCVVYRHNVLAGSRGDSRF